MLAHFHIASLMHLQVCLTVGILEPLKDEPHEVTSSEKASSNGDCSAVGILLHFCTSQI